MWKNVCWGWDKNTLEDFIETKRSRRRGKIVE
ncbi:MAG: hypothetical protein MRERV_32c048 [Mycoplasmataceae bacterium RV_VA103A]|nr:MAG: hypothetical protein MRERV_32c048 [Mycoplasmataceae bacterium RV_VA103A]